MNDVLKAALRQRFDLFLMKVYEHLHPGKPPLKMGWYLQAICHHLMTASTTEGSRLVISIPPRHLKSIAASVALPAFVLGHDPTKRIMVGTYSERLARQHSIHCRRMMESDWYRELFPDLRMAETGNRILEFNTTMGGSRMAVTVGGSVTGFGADLIVGDDCLQASDARSAAKREEAQDWFDGTLSTRMNELGEGAVISIAQRLHEDDLPAHLLAKGYGHLCLPAIAEKDEFIQIGRNRFHHRVIGSLLDRPGHTREKLERERVQLGPQRFSAQFQQEPVAAAGNLIRLEWFGTFDEVLERARYYRLVQSWDTAGSDEPDADYSVCTTWGYLDNHWHLLDVLRGQLAFPDLKRAVLRQQRLWRPDKVLIEDAGTGLSLWQELRRGHPFKPLMRPARQDKETRLIGVTGQLEAGVCKLPAEAPWLEDYQRELRAFPYGRNDDQVDSTTQFLEYLIARQSSLLAERAPNGRKMDVTRRQSVRRPPDRRPPC
jgi:predicted phage terminase large subunit-like protein